MTSEYTIGIGKILLAEPFMIDPNFRRSVILLSDHSETEGSIGFVMNKPLQMSVNELIDDFPQIDLQVHFGGPVATDTIHYLHTKGHLFKDARLVSAGIFWGGDFERLKDLIDTGLISPNDIRFFVGYSGWSAGQLYGEMDRKSWISGDMKPDYLFKSEKDAVWKQAMRDLGGRYAVIGDIPEFVSMN